MPLTSILHILSPETSSQKLTTARQRKGEYDRRKYFYFMTNLHVLED